MGKVSAGMSMPLDGLIAPPGFLGVAPGRPVAHARPSPATRRRPAVIKAGLTFCPGGRWCPAPWQGRGTSPWRAGTT